MKGLTVAVLGDAALAAAMGKKGTVSDMSFFNFKKGDIGVTYVVPSRYPEKLQSLANALAMSDAAILSVEKLDKELGEQIVALDAFGIKHGFMILKNYISADQLRPFVARTTLEEFRFFEPDAYQLNEEFAAMDIPYVDGNVRVPVDHFFDVKGVGTVALGRVRRGIARQHDELQVFPTEKRTQVRSIQVHDEDVPEAIFGCRVGLALKGIEAKDLFRGAILAPPGSLKVAEKVTTKLAVSRYWKGTVSKGLVLHGACGLQIVPMRVEEAPGDGLGPGKTGDVVFRLEKPLAFDPGDRLVALDLDSKGLRMAGWGICP
jgi:selenocysteine-specific translation elongation factor